MAENKKGFITLTVVFEAMSLNRDEGMGNLQTLHLLTRGNGEVYSYMSRQALTYAVRKFLIESGEWPEAKVNPGDVTQYEPDIKKYPEVDLFGYMVTTSGESSGEGTANTRPAAVTISHAISLEPYNGDMAFYANPEMARRSGSNPNPYNRQEHKSLYKYSVVIDLERIGKDDENSKIALEDEEKVKRICQLLEAIKNLHHQIMAYREPLYPLFIAAAHLKYGSPIFHNYVELKYNKEKKAVINGELFENGLEHAKKIAKNGNKRVIWGMLKGAGALHLDIEGVETSRDGKPIDVIEKVKNWVCEIYGVNSSECKDGQ